MIAVAASLRGILYISEQKIEPVERQPQRAFTIDVSSIVLLFALTIDMPPAQLRLDIGQALTARGQQHQDMIEQIGGLLDDALVALPLGRDDHLDRLFADLL